MNHDLASTLKATGFISHDQLEHHFALNIANIELAPGMLHTRDGLWDAGQYRRGGHLAHWTLRTEVFLAMADNLVAWHRAAPLESLVQPDALLTFVGQTHPIALEVDSGKETRGQWHEKLQEYQLAPQDWHVLVIAKGQSRRQSHLRAWLCQDAPRPWLLIPSDPLPHNWDWHWSRPQNSRAILIDQLAGRTRLYLLNGNPIPTQSAEQLLKARRAQIHGYERRHSSDVYHLILL